MANIQEFLKKILNARYGKDVRQSIHDSISEINRVTEQAESIASTAKDSALHSAAVASESAVTATQKAESAGESAAVASESAVTATQKAESAGESAAVASESAVTAMQKAEEAESSSSAASNSAIVAESYAHGDTGAREYEAVDNAKYYYEQAKQISQGINGVIPMGTVAFANIPTSGLKYGYMYNISDEFISDERFADGSGLYYGPGNNIIWVAGDKWDVTAASSVTGVKGAKEDTYRQGNVNITSENIGALAKDGDSAENTATFTSGDAASATAWTDVSVLQSGEKHKSVFNKISTMFKNIRYLYKMLGTSDISTIGNGTVTGAVNAINGSLSNKAEANHNHNGVYQPVGNYALSGHTHDGRYYTENEVNSKLDNYLMKTTVVKCPIVDGRANTNVCYLKHGSSVTVSGVFTTNIAMTQGIDYTFFSDLPIPHNANAAISVYDSSNPTVSMSGYVSSTGHIQIIAQGTSLDAGKSLLVGGNYICD